MRRLLLPLGLAALFFSPLVLQAQPAPETQPSFGADGPILTLAGALDLAAARSHVLAAARRQVDASSGGVLQAGLMRNPSVSGVVEDTRSRSRETTASLEIPIELGGKRAARVSAAERGREFAEAELSNTRADIKATVSAAFFDILVAQERVKLAEDSAALATRNADVVAKRVTAGKVSPVDATRARVEAVNADLEVTEARSILKSARQALAATWGDADLPYRVVEGDVERLLVAGPAMDWQAAADHSPTVFAGQVEVARRHALLEVERTKRIPDVTVTVGARRVDETARTQAVIGLSMPLPLFDRNQGNVYEAASRRNKAEDDLQAARIRITNELQRSSNQLAVARQTAQTLKDTVVPAAEGAVRAATQGFEAGKFGFLDVIDAQRTLLLARTRYLTTLSGAVQASTNIDRLLGR